MHVQLTQRIMFWHLKQIQNHIFPPWHRNDTVSYICFSCGPDYPRQESSRVPTFVDYLPRLWELSHRYIGLPPGHPMAWWYYFFTVIILALLFKHIFKLTFKYVQSSPFSKPSLLESTIEVSHDLFKISMFENDLKSICMYGMNVFL